MQKCREKGQQKRHPLHTALVRRKSDGQAEHLQFPSCDVAYLWRQPIVSMGSKNAAWCGQRKGEIRIVLFKCARLLVAGALFGKREKRGHAVPRDKRPAGPLARVYGGCTLCWYFPRKKRKKVTQEQEWRKDALQ
ncbi:hypothetical protein pneo_cds_229 [Pandoravirus neocaledonia]|uniref:Uncharacterized protein n=1 Tax=Pandoravirus neocaledonia TaxID=2107708 RepID=A0A2U7UBM1_9VIRU|nr:hypothetical protein pneo_cds_229 [Pandoravirus neocaledonia]AVK75836.1 hypothetical protein pneo_cds_229 [Pandoravirus neocaledonia]